METNEQEQPLQSDLCQQHSDHFKTMSDNFSDSSTEKVKSICISFDKYAINYILEEGEDAIFKDVLKMLSKRAKDRADKYKEEANKLRKKGK